MFGNIEIWKKREISGVSIPTTQTNTIKIFWGFMIGLLKVLALCFLIDLILSTSYK